MPRDGEVRPVNWPSFALGVIAAVIGGVVTMAVALWWRRSTGPTATPPPVRLFAQNTGAARRPWVILGKTNYLFLHAPVEQWHPDWPYRGLLTLFNDYRTGHPERALTVGWDGLITSPAGQVVGTMDDVVWMGEAEVTFSDDWARNISKPFEENLN